MSVYGDHIGVGALVPAAAINEGGSVPQSEHVEEWLSQATSIINRTLANAGFAVPISDDAQVRPELNQLSNLFAGAYVIRARGLDTVQGVDEDRSVVWLDEFYERLNELAASDLTAMGVNRTNETVADLGFPRPGIRSRSMKRADGYSAITDEYS